MARAFLVALALLGATSSAMAASWQDIAADCKKAAAGPGGITRADIAFAAGFCMGIVEGALWSLPRTDFWFAEGCDHGTGSESIGQIYRRPSRRTTRANRVARH